MRVKVRHGLVRWREPRTDGRPGEVVRTGFRAMTVDIPDDQARERLASGAVILPDDELKSTGRMLPLPTNGSDEEFKAWVSVATDTEIAEACSQHPDLADRIREARAVYDQGIADQNEILGGSAGAATPEADPGTSVPDAGAQGQEQGVTDDGTGTTDADGGDASEDDFTDEDIDEVVAGNVTEVSEFLSEYPEMAQKVLDAEARRAEAANDDVRKGVEHAAQVAASHAAS